MLLAKTTIRVDLKLRREDFVGSPKMYWFLYTVAYEGSWKKIYSELQAVNLKFLQESDSRISSK